MKGIPYLNPDPYCRFIGPKNLGEALIDGELATCLLDNSTFSEKGDQECPGHDFLMSRSAVHYVSLCFFQKQGLKITVFLFFDFSSLGNFVLTTLFLFEILVIASLGGAARRT